MLKFVKGFIKSNKLLIFIFVMSVFWYLVLFQEPQIGRIIMAITTALVIVIEEFTGLFKNMLAKDILVNALVVLFISFIGKITAKVKNQDEKKEDENDS